MFVLVALGVVVFIVVVVLIVTRVLRRNSADRDVAAFDAGQQALGRASKRSPRSTL